MAEIKSQIIEKLDEKPTGLLYVDNNSDVVANADSNLANANGSTLLIKKAIKEYIDRNLSDYNKLFEGYVYTNSDIIIADGEYNENNYLISYRPFYFIKESESIVVDFTKNGILGQAGYKILNIKGFNVNINETIVKALIYNSAMDTLGCKINDINCDGSENSKHLTKIVISDIPGIFYNKNLSYRYFITEHGEIFSGYLDIDNNVIQDISRGVLVNSENKPYEINILNNGEKLYVLNCVRLFYNTVTDSIKPVIGEHLLYLHNWNSSFERKNGDCYYQESDKKWYIFENRVLNSYDNLIYLGDVVYSVPEIIEQQRVVNFVGFKVSDLKFIIDNVSNIDLLKTGNLVYTNSDKTFISVFNKMVEFYIDRLKWDLSNYQENVYLYIDGDSKTWVDILRPKYINELGYYGHYYHYWRCVGKCEYNNGDWIVKGEKEI